MPTGKAAANIRKKKNDIRQQRIFLKKFSEKKTIHTHKNNFSRVIGENNSVENGIVQGIGKTDTTRQPAG